MAGSVNKVILIGNLGKDPEVRRTQDGKPICNLTIATSETWRDKNSGERKEKTEWHRVVIFSEPLCKVAEQYLKQMLGLAASNDDDGKAGAEGGAITLEQVEELVALCDEVSADKEAFCKYFRVESFADISAKDFPRAVAALNKKRAK